MLSSSAGDPQRFDSQKIIMIAIPSLPSPHAVALHRARTELLKFTQWTKPDYQVARHHRIMGRWLDRLQVGVIKRLMLFCPPRHGKSELVSRRLPAFYMGKHPDREVVVSSYAADLANKMNRDVQRIIEQPEYRRLFPGVRMPMVGERQHGRQKAKRTDSFFELVGRKGSLRSAGVGGGITGMGFHLGIIDDPLKNFEEAHSQVIRDKLDEWYSSTFWTRQAANSSILITMTRWHHDDIAGRLLERMAADNDADQWTVVRLPAVADEDLHPDDHRQVGEVLWPERFDERFMQQARGTLGSYLFTGLYQQTPEQEGGNYFKAMWFDQSVKDAGDFWDMDVRGLIGKIQCPVFVSVDPACSEDQQADFTAIGVFAVTPWNDLIVLDMVRERLPLEGISKRVLEVCHKWKAGWVSFEATGFQMAVVNQARQTKGMPPVREMSHEGKGKLVRATPAIIKAESGQIFLRQPSDAELSALKDAGKTYWKKAFIDELTAFTGLDDRHDDQVDVLSYAVWQLPRMAMDRSKDDLKSEHSSTRPSIDSIAERVGLWGRGQTR